MNIEEDILLEVHKSGGLYPTDIEHIFKNKYENINCAIVRLLDNGKLKLDSNLKLTLGYATYLNKDEILKRKKELNDDIINKSNEINKLRAEINSMNDCLHKLTKEAFPETIYVWSKYFNEDLDDIYALKRSSGKEDYSNSCRIWGRIYDTKIILYMYDDISDHPSDTGVWFPSLEDCVTHREKILKKQIEEIKNKISSPPKVQE